MSVPLKRLVVGRPLAHYEDARQRLPKRTGLAVFASDAISSTAYASEEILHILAPVLGLVALDYLLPISGVVAAVLVVVVASYRQTIHAYPSGGGAYIVARENLGRTPSLVAGASLLVDYTLTVAVSISAGVAAVVSAFPQFLDDRVAIGVGVVALLTLLNLRGAKESGTLLSIPTYGYILAMGLFLAVGLYRAYLGDLGPMPLEQHGVDAGEGSAAGLVGLAGVLLLARAFSSGAVALTGIEAITNGVPAFRPPEARNAARTLAVMALILGSFFFGISALADRLRPPVSFEETILSAMGAHVLGRGSVLYLVLQFATMGILFLAANTAFADFPRLASIVARDGFLPRQLAARGDRLVYSNGILALATAAGLLLAAFEGITTALIPLYAVGVFTSFTLSQVGMVRHHLRLRAPGWRLAAVVNGAGASATAVVLVVVAVSKFTTGAWVPVVVIPVIIVTFSRIRSHYDRVSEGLRADPGWTPAPIHHTVIVLAADLHQGVLRALTYAQSLKPDHITALAIVEDEADKERLERKWNAFHPGVPLTVLVNPYRELTRPVLQFIDDYDRRWEDDIITVVIPEFVVRHWWENLLHNQSALVLKWRLLFRKDTVVTSVPVHLER